MSIRVMISSLQMLVIKKNVDIVKFFILFYGDIVNVVEYEDANARMHVM